jgi:hypothetical protein
MAYQEGHEWRMLHHGKYEMTHFPPPSKVHYPRHEILFRPEDFEETPEPLFISLLESRDLPAQRVVEYDVTFPTRPDDPYILFVPKHKEHAGRDSWMIRAEGVVIKGGYFGAR